MTYGMIKFAGSLVDFIGANTQWPAYQSLSKMWMLANDSRCGPSRARFLPRQKKLIEKLKDETDVPAESTAP